MRTRSVLFVVVVGSAGCAGILGIPSDVDRADGTTEGGPGPVEGGTNEGGPMPMGMDGESPDAPVDAPIDSPPPPPPCDPTKSFDPPTPLDSLNTAEDEGAARFSEDELTIYVDAIRSARSPRFDIYYATRTALTDTFGPLTSFPSVDDTIDTLGNDEYAPNVTADGLSLVFERQNFATKNSDIWIATRSSPTAPFGTATTVANLNTTDYEANPFVRGSVTELWHVRKPTDNVDIALATLKPAGYVVSIPNNVNTPSYDGSPVLSKDGLVMYFSSMRAGAGMGGTNVWVTTRATLATDFGAPVPVANVNSEQNEYPGWISGDGCRLYLVSSRPGKGEQDIYVATRPK